jgi:hypothetical protein
MNIKFSNPLACGNGTFIDNVSSFPVWSAGHFDESQSDQIVVDAGSWSTALTISGVDLSMIETIRASLRCARALEIVPTEYLRPLDVEVTAAVAALRTLVVGISDGTTPALAALPLVTKLLLASKQAITFITVPSVIQNLHINHALLHRAYRLLQFAVNAQA